MASTGEIRTGSKGPFYWLTGKRTDLRTLVSACPEIVLGKYVLVTAYHSWRFLPTVDEIAAGWRIVGAVAVSPIVEDVTSLPAEGRVEWYVSSTADTPRRPAMFVNCIGFRLDWPMATPDESARGITWDWHDAEAEMQWRAGLIGQFWRQLNRLGAESYLADGDHLNFATRDSVLFDRVRSYLAPEAN